MSDRVVDRDPALTVGELFRAVLPGPAVPAESQTESSHLRYTLDGRSALALYLGGLGAPVGARVLLPALICRSVLDAVEAVGWGADFYEVTEDLTPDPEDFWGRVTPQTRAALAVHYFGLGVPLPDLLTGCRERGIRLIEDCAHAWLSEGTECSPGTIGDAAIYSLRKFLPIADGGLLRINHREGSPVHLPGRRRQPPWRHAQITKELIQRLAWPKPRRIGTLHSPPAGRPTRSGIQRALGVPESPGPQSPGWGRLRVPLLQAAAWDLGVMLRRVIRSADPVWIRAARRANYQYLDRGIRTLSHVHPLRPELPEGACPLAYPLIPRRREGFDVGLRHEGIQSFTFGDPLPSGVDAGAAPRAEALRRSVILIPCHQRLRPGDLERILEVIARTNRSREGI